MLLLFSHPVSLYICNNSRNGANLSGSFIFTLLRFLHSPYYTTISPEYFQKFYKQKDRPVLIDTFENGYCFKDGNIVKNSFKDDNANVIEKFKSVSFDYQKNGDVVSFEQQKFNSKLTPAGDIIATINGTNLYYVHYINKVVSDDYELTEQDKKDQASGKVVFSYDDSASQIEVSQVQSVNWNKDGIQYDLLQIDGKLSAGELADMAREVINNRR